MARAAWDIDVPDLPKVRSAFGALAKMEDLPYAREALADIQAMGGGAIRAEAESSIGGTVKMLPVVGEGLAIRAPIKVLHPASKTKEFGRTTFYEGFTKTGPVVDGRRQARKGDMKGGRKVKRTGMRPEPYVGVKDGGHAIGRIAPKARELAAEALAKEWARLAGGEMGTR